MTKKEIRKLNYQRLKKAGYNAYDCNRFKEHNQKSIYQLISVGTRYSNDIEYIKNLWAIKVKQIIDGDSNE